MAKKRQPKLSRRMHLWLVSLMHLGNDHGREKALQHALPEAEQDKEVTRKSQQLRDTCLARVEAEVLKLETTIRRLKADNKRLRDKPAAVKSKEE